MKDFGAQSYLFPCPVLMLGTYDEKEEPDLMNAAWGGICDYNKVAISLSSHQTTDNLAKKGCLTIAFATSNLVKASDYCGIVSKKNEPNKIKKSGLHYEKAPHIDAPLFTDYPISLECVVESLDMEKGILRARIEHVLADESVLAKDGKIDIRKAHIITFDSSHNTYIELGEEVGKAFQDGLALK